MKDPIRGYSGVLKDAFGNDVKIGDTVAVIAEEGYAHRLRRTVVVAFGEHAGLQYFKVMAVNRDGDIIYDEAMNHYVLPDKVALAT